MGKVIRFLKALRHLDYNLARFQDMIIRLEEWAQHSELRIDESEQRISESERRIVELEYKGETLSDRTKVFNQRTSEVERRLNWDDKRLDEIERMIHLIYSSEKPFLDTLVNQISKYDDLLCRLNKEMSIRPVIWGEPERLHVSPLASVFPCFFNTNSGEITIGDYTFSGSGVSILAGTHDKQLSGLLRRDAEIREGCDIVIGSGVWLGSGSIILGPSTIGDNAVIAAGAVVTPGTNVPKNTVFGGVPAKQIGTVDTFSTKDWNAPPVQSALVRNGGILFAEGWSEKRIIPGCSQIGHYFVAEEGTLLINQDRFNLFYSKNNAEEMKLLIRNNELSKTIELPGRDGCIEIRFPIGKELLTVIKLSTKPYSKDLFIAIYPVQEE